MPKSAKIILCHNLGSFVSSIVL